MGTVCSCKVAEKEGEDKAEIQVNQTTATDRKKGGSDEEIEEIKENSNSSNKESNKDSNKDVEKSDFLAKKQDALEGFSYLPFETKMIGITTLTQHLLQKKTASVLKDSVLDFSLLLSHIQASLLKISDRIQRRYFFQNGKEDHEKLVNDCCDIFENELKESEQCCVIYCIRREKLYQEDLHGEHGTRAKYVVMFTGLDNTVDPECNSGSMFAIWKRVTTKFRPLSEKDDILQSCSSILASGYCMYGQGIQLVLAINSDVNGFVYDSVQKEFILSHPKIKAASRTGIISIDTSKESAWEPHVKIFLTRRYARKDKKQSVRYTGSIVADAHRSLLYGGILMFPLTIPGSDGDISLIEAFILGYIFEKSWGRASSGEGGSISQMKLFNLQQKTQFFCGASSEIVELENLFLSIARRQSIISKSLASRFSSNQSIGLNNSLDSSLKSNSSPRDSLIKKILYS